MAVALLATCVVVVGGAFTCVMIGLASGEELPRSLGFAGGCFAGIVLVLWLLRDRKATSSTRMNWGWLGRRRRKVEFRVALRPRPDDQPSRPLSPPTAESIRELGGGINTWVPSQTAPPPRKKSSA
ncbi:MAG: hypothetical protein ACKV0T_08195 [Planctomycetales bacterium]